MTPADPVGSPPAGPPPMAGAAASPFADRQDCPHGFGPCREALDHLAGGRFDVPVRWEPSCAACGRLEAIRQVGETLRGRAEASADLLRLTARLTANPTLDEVLDGVYEGFHRHIPYDRIGVALIEEDKKTGEGAGPWVRATWVRSAAPQILLGRDFRARLAGSSLQTIIETGQPRILNDLEAYLAEHPQSAATRLIVQEGVRSSLTCPLRAGGRPIGFLFFSSFRKATYQSLHQEVFTQIADNLSIIVERTMAYQRLVELNSLKNRFLGIAAHDLRSPLALVVSFLDMLEDPDLANDPAQRTRIFGRMRAAATRMLGMVNDLLDLSAIESGQIQITREVVDLRPLLDEIFEHHSLLAQRKQIALRRDFADGLPPLSVDPRRLQQVLDNLLTNAAKFSPAGTTVTLGARTDGGQLHLWVADQGAGIPPDELPRLFKEFGKTSVRPTDGEKSTGLGLAIVRKIVERHGGTVGVTSEVGKGSTFWVRLPLE